MRVEFGVLDVKVFLIEPGSIKTEFHTKAISSLEDEDQENFHYVATYRWLKDNEYSPFFAMAEIEPIEIARLVEKIIAKNRAKTRYVIPFMVRIIMVFNTIMSDMLMDIAMRKTFHLYESKRK